MNASNAPEKPRTAREMLRMAREFLVRKGVVEARLEGELLVAHALTLTRLELFMQLDRPVSGVEIDAARDLLVRRGRREPVAYITGKREFYGRLFAVGPGVLIPRSETELLVDRARKIWSERSSGESMVASQMSAEHELSAASSSRPSPFIADVGTGSGCIAITLALEIPGAEVLAAELSPPAAEVARANARSLGASIAVREGDGLTILRHAITERQRRFDLIVSNPPYVTREEAATLAPEVREHEPELALFAPAGDPDHWVRRLLDVSADLLVPGGTLLVELGARQGKRALTLAQEHGWQSRLECDLAGIERVLEARTQA